MPDPKDRGFSLRMPKESSPLARGDNHLFVVGINAYQHVARLDNAVRDAKAFRDVLLDRYRFEADHVTELYDGDATRKNISKKLWDLPNKIKGEDSLIIFFSGHGHYEKERGQGYWVPVDAAFQEEFDYISYNLILETIKVTSARHILLIVDSCYSGAVLVKGKDMGIKRLERDKSRWIIASGRNEVVPDGLAGTNSPFTRELLDLLKNYSDDGMATQWLSYRLIENVTQNSPQTPIGKALYGVGDQGGQFIFYPRRNETRDWTDARAKLTAASYRQFLKSYPEGQYADEARWQLASLQDTKAAYRQYTDKGGAYYNEAVKRLGEIEEKDRFDRANSRGEAALLKFMTVYPDSNLREQAQAEIVRIRAQEREPEAWRTAQAAGKIEAFQTYLDTFPGGSHTREAREFITRLQVDQKAADAREAARKRKEATAAKQEAKRKAQAAEARRKKEEKRAAATPLLQRPPVRYGLIGLPILVLLIWGMLKLTGNDPTPIPVDPQKYADNGTDGTTPEDQIPIPEMKQIAGGTFLMGSTEADTDAEDREKPQHSVKISPFEMGVYEVTVEQYLAFCEATKTHWPEWLEEGSDYHVETGSDDHYKKRGYQQIGSEKLPIVGVSWDDARAYADWLNQKSGKSGWRLPTEGEWEYAAGGGMTKRKSDGSRTYTYAGSNSLDSYGWYTSNSNGKTHPVGQKRPNGLDLYDMSGNVWEWCLDTYDSDYYSTCNSQGTVSNPQGPNGGRRRVLRGGSWNDDASLCRVADRNRRYPDLRGSDCGFRLARTL